MRQDLEVKLHQSGTKQAARHLAERKFRRRRKYPETSKTFIVLVIMPLHFDTSGCSPGFGFDLERRTIAIACAVCNLPSRHAISSTVFLKYVTLFLPPPQRLQSYAMARPTEEADASAAKASLFS